MKTTKLRLIALITTALTIGATTFGVSSSEQYRKLQKYMAEQQYYQELYSGWQLYKDQYASQVAKIKEENTQKMLSTRTNYENALMTQPGLISLHTRTVPDTNTPTVSGTVAPQSLSNNTAAQTITVTKPQSKPKTKTS
ncbi:hypothetical protein A3K34_01625 [candidate division WWE3 bacterium RIFOXYC1_FULL_40_10]|nr:MAG: hypothetical protein A3K58_01625 [candidate division WWE3 bacterium RIFOXYB1_FULL_40_22]OGC61565.1 MAG: hypothetical protein A3K37_01625 [candidate division WWE3 bacterium RIFOXYA1_FULL_40_11]OGC65948.1 MAG: hypothetical protein A3K34_01625 [candidate division WWE3 bacterium RIFOXYC1_FULL_40_10]OGC67097.1 MAG: hypothetical protein A2450_04435 [candidate division WWE3 bacterium RIFOXYC2_FULL_40_11]HLD51123.1 hypothetical protein [Patescibacteria group bacterium]